VIAPDLAPLNGLINRGDTLFNRELTQISKLPRSQQNFYLTRIFGLRDRLVSALTDRWVTHPWPAQSLIEVSPLVTWLWFGGIIAAIGGLIALWPVPRRPRRDRGARGTRAPGSGTRETEDGLAGAGAPRERELIARMEPTWPAT
jgi:cytochrome c-type biogenesis protein CcmF